MRALLLSVVLCGAGFASGEDKPALPENVQAYKERCLAEQAKIVARLEKNYDASKAVAKSAKSAGSVAAVKKSLEALKAAKAAPWHSHRVRIDTSTAGSIGEFFTPSQGTPIAVRFRCDKLNGDTVIGAIIHDGATPKLLVRAGGAVAGNIYSEPGAASETKATISGGTGFVEGKQTTLKGLFEVVSTKPLTLKPFDVSPFE